MGPLETVFDLGIIPADAGSTRTYVDVFDVIQDHPRGCGEHVSSYQFGYGMSGSSPRMRGAPAGDHAERC